MIRVADVLFPFADLKADRAESAWRAVPFLSVPEASSSTTEQPLPKHKSLRRVSSDFISAKFIVFNVLVPRGGIEPPTQGFSILRSTTELPRHVWSRRKMHKQRTRKGRKFQRKIKEGGSAGCHEKITYKSIDK